MLLQEQRTEAGWDVRAGWLALADGDGRWGPERCVTWPQREPCRWSGRGCVREVQRRVPAGRLQHLHPGGSAPSVGKHRAATFAANHMKVKGCLIGGGECAVECVGEHRLTLGAMFRVCRLRGFRAAELVDVRHLNHLPFYTLQKPCKFPTTATDAAFYSSFRNAEHLGDLFIIHVFEVTQNNSFAQLRRELFESALDPGLEFETGYVMFLGWPGIGQPLGHGGTVFFAVECG